MLSFIADLRRFFGIVYHFIELLYGLNKLMFTGKQNSTVLKYYMILLYEIILMKLQGHY